MSTYNTEEVLQYVSRNYVTVNEGEMRENKQRLENILVKVTNAMKEVSPLFKELFEKFIYGGSTYDGLKVGKPDEFDIDLVLKLPTDLHSQVLPSDKAGFVYIYLTDWDRCALNKEQFSKYEELIKYKDGDNYLSQVKIKNWMKSIVTNAISGITVTQKESGPAITLIDGNSDNEISIDLVAVFRIPEEQWPPYPVRQNPYTKTDFLVVPKPPKESDLEADPARYWRLSFPLQEREIMNGLNFCKPTIRFLKKLRNTHSNVYVPSYFIKTVFLWEIQKRDRSFWNGSLKNVYLEMLKVYRDCIKDEKIPYFWSSDNKFLHLNKDIHIANIIYYLEAIIKEIERKEDDPFIMVKSLLTSTEYNEVCNYFKTKDNNSIVAIHGNTTSTVANINRNYEVDVASSRAYDTNSSSDIMTTLSDNAEAIALGIGGIALLGTALYKFFSPSTPQRNRNN